MASVVVTVLAAGLFMLAFRSRGCVNHITFPGAPNLQPAQQNFMAKGKAKQGRSNQTEGQTDMWGKIAKALMAIWSLLPTKRKERIIESICDAFAKVLGRFWDRFTGQDKNASSAGATNTEQVA